MNIGFLASHNGSNMQAIIDACKSGALQATPVVVISNNGGSGALARAKDERVPVYHLSGKTHPEPTALDQAILNALVQHDVDMVIAQARVPIEPTDTPETLAERVLQKEHTFFPETLQRIATGELCLQARAEN